MNMTEVGSNVCRTSPRRRGRGPFEVHGASSLFFTCNGTMNGGGGCAVAIASWTAAVLCRFCAPRPKGKAPEDWRTPKPGGPLDGSWDEGPHAASAPVQLLPQPAVQAKQ